MKWLFGISIAAIAMWAATALMPAPAAVAVDEVSLKFLPPETQGIVFIDVAALRNAALVQDALHGKDLTLPSSLDELIRKTGFDPQRDLDKVTIAKLGPKDVLVIGQGRIDKFKVEAFLKDQGNAPEAYLGRTLYRDGDGTFALFDNVVLAGPNGAVKRGIDQMQLPASQPLRSDLAALIRTIEPGNQLWGAGEVSVQDLGAIGIRGPAPALEMLKSLRSGTFQMRVDSGLHARATGDLGDAESAKNIADLALGALALAKVQVGRQKPDLMQVLDGVQVSYSGALVTVRIEQSGQAVEKVKDLRPAIERVLQ